MYWLYIATERLVAVFCMYMFSLSTAFHVIVEVWCVPVVALEDLSRHLYRVAEQLVTVFWVYVFSRIRDFHVSEMSTHSRFRPIPCLWSQVIAIKQDEIVGRVYLCPRYIARPSLHSLCTSYRTDCTVYLIRLKSIAFCEIQDEPKGFHGRWWHAIGWVSFHGQSLERFQSVTC